MKIMWYTAFLLVTSIFQGAIPQGGSTQTEKAPAYLKQAVITQSGDAVNVAANSARPLLQALDALQQKFGWIVDYEDARYVSHLDYVDVPGDTSRPQLPAGGSFSVDISAKAPEAESLHHVVDAYNQSKNPGRFEVRSGENNRYYVVGTAAHDEKGEISQQHALFDLQVTVPARERTIADSIQLICALAAKQAHTTVTLGVSPRNFLEHAQAKIGGAKTPARALLQECLAATHRNLYWRLIFDPSSKGYFLDIHAAPKS